MNSAVDNSVDLGRLLSATELRDLIGTLTDTKTQALALLRTTRDMGDLDQILVETERRATQVLALLEARLIELQSHYD